MTGENTRLVTRLVNNLRYETVARNEARYEPCVFAVCDVVQYIIKTVNSE